VSTRIGTAGRCEPTTRALRAESYAVDVAEDGARGWELAQSYAYDLIILDLMLPQLPGEDLLRRIRRSNPAVPILVLTDSPRTYRQLALVWGVIPELVQHCATYDEMVRIALEVVRRRGLARNGDRVIVTAGVPFDVPGTTNMMKVETV